MRDVCLTNCYVNFPFVDLLKSADKKMSASDEENPYEAQRLANIARNKALLESLGLDSVRIPDATTQALEISQKQNKSFSLEEGKY